MKPPPHSSDAEQGVLACCMRDSEQILTECIEAKITPESFYVPVHAALYDAMLTLYKRGQPVDEISLLNEIVKQGTAEQIGGMAGINAISERIETTAHARYWIDIVREQYLLRRLIRLSSKTIEACYDRKGDVTVFVGEVEQEVFKISQEQVTDSAAPIRDAMAGVMEKVKGYVGQQVTDYGVLTGFADLDRLTFGLHPSEMVVIAARPSVGKTSLAMNIAEFAAMPKNPDVTPPVGVMVFSLEMPTDQLAMRLLCGRARVNLNSLRDGITNASDQANLVQVSNELKEAPIYIDDSMSLNILEMRAKARRLKARVDNLGLIMIDYLQLVSGTDGRIQREQQIAEISRGVKAMARELGVPVIVLSQLNRESEKDKRDPRMSDLRESGSIEQDADVVMLLHRPKVDEKEDNFRSDDVERIKLILAKQRNGPTGVVDLAFRRRYTRFENFAAGSVEGI